MFKIFTAAVNNPFFLLAQAVNFKRFLKCDYEFYVLDDAKTEEVIFGLQSIAREQDVKYISYPHRNPTVGSPSTDSVIQWAWDTIITEDCKDDLVLFCDSDLFLMENFDPYEYMGDHAISASLSERGHVKYMWNGIMFFDMKQVLQMNGNLNFNLGNIEGQMCDSGGHTYYFLKENNVDVKEIAPTFGGMYRGHELNNMEHFIDGKFLHFRGGSLWDGKLDLYNQKMKLLDSILRTL